MSDSYGLSDGDWYEASDGQWYCWPDPTPHASKPVAPPPAPAMAVPPMPVSVPASGGWDPPAQGAPSTPSFASQAFEQAYAAPAYAAAPPAAPSWAPPAAPQQPQPSWGAPPQPGFGGPPPTFTQTAKEHKGRTLALVIIGGIVGLGIITSVVQSLNNADRDSSGNVTDAGNSGVLALRVGDCLPKVGSGQVEKVEVTPCAQPHAGEIFHIFDLSGGSFPGTQQVATQAEEGCLAALPAFLGTPTADAGYELSTLSPVKSSWNLDGGKKVKCVLTVPRDGTMIGSAKGRGAYQP